MNVLRIGHRGSKGYIAENTLESINHAILLEVDGIEIDIFKFRVSHAQSDFQL